MDTISGRPGRPMPPHQQDVQSQRPAASAPTGRFDKPKKSPKRKGLLIAAVVAAIVLLAGLYALKTYVLNPIAGDKYQAVFLTNGQVYFGKLHQIGGNYYKLSNVYYLQATQSNDGSSNPQQAATANSGVQLIKLGNEVHGPEDSMVIERSQVLFFENLKNDGKVVDSINKYQNKK
jgi:hypothetical protein